MDILDRNAYFNFTGDVIQPTLEPVFHPATGDILDVTHCSLNKPYDNAKLNFLRNNISIAEKKLAMAKSIEKQADVNLTKCQHARLGLFCKKKYGGSRSDLSRKLAAAHVDVNTAQKALDAAKSEYDRAIGANKTAQTGYDKCLKDEQERLRIEAENKKAELERQKQLDALKTQQQIKQEEQLTERKKVSVAKLEASKDYALYAGIAVGAIAIGFFGYKLATS